MAFLVSPGVSVTVTDDHWYEPKYYCGPTYDEILEFVKSNGSITFEELENFYSEHKVFSKLKDPHLQY